MANGNCAILNKRKASCKKMRENVTVMSSDEANECIAGRNRSSVQDSDVNYVGDGKNYEHASVGQVFLYWD